MKFRPVDPTGECMHYNGAGVPYEELSCLYPTLGGMYLPWVPRSQLSPWPASYLVSKLMFVLMYSFERYYDPTPVKNWIGYYSWFPSLVVVAYALMIVGGRAYFANRPAWNWRGTLAVCNLLLSIFSLAGFIRSAPQLAHNVMNYSWREYLCMDPFSTGGSGSSGLWGQLFVLSKLP